MRTCVLKFPEDHYPGVFIRAEDAKRIAECLKLLEAKPTKALDELLMNGARDPLPEVIELLESCWVGGTV
jgi:hypothetical protein